MYYTIFNCIKSIPKLFYRNTLGKISGLIYIETLGNTDVITEKLKRNNRKASDKVLVHLRYGHGHDSLLPQRQAAAAALALHHVA